MVPTTMEEYCMKPKSKHSSNGANENIDFDDFYDDCYDMVEDDEDQDASEEDEDYEEDADDSGNGES